MPNRGVITKEGHTRATNMQSTDVNKALMSVATIGDAGNTVMFKKDCTEAVKRRHDGGKHNVPHDREFPRVGFCEAGMRSNGQHKSAFETGITNFSGSATTQRDTFAVSFVLPTLR